LASIKARPAAAKSSNVVGLLLALAVEIPAPALVGAAPGYARSHRQNRRSTSDSRLAANEAGIAMP